MMAAPKGAPRTEFRTPPGLRMYRVTPETGEPAGAGGPGIWEGYKPGTEPGKDRGRPAPAGQIVQGVTARVPVRATPASGTGGVCLRTGAPRPSLGGAPKPEARSRARERSE